MAHHLDRGHYRGSEHEIRRYELLHVNPFGLIATSGFTHLSSSNVPKVPICRLFGSHYWGNHILRWLSFSLSAIACYDVQDFACPSASCFSATSPEHHTLAPKVHLSKNNLAGCFTRIPAKIDLSSSIQTASTIGPVTTSSPDT